jgi:hypothetical protein
MYGLLGPELARTRISEYLAEADQRRLAPGTLRGRKAVLSGSPCRRTPALWRAAGLVVAVWAQLWLAVTLAAVLLHLLTS